MSSPSLPLAYHRVVVATGGAPHSQKAVERAAQLAQHFSAEVHVVTVVPQVGTPLTSLVGAFPGGETFDVQARQDDLSRRTVHLEHTAEALRSRGLRVHAHLRPSLKAADAILAVAGEVGADLIVLGRKHKTALSAALAGSVADAVSHAAPCDVLVAR